MKHQWPPQVSSALHQFSDSAPDAPSLTSVLEPHATEKVAGSPSFRVRTNRRRLVIACAAIVAVVGIVGVAIRSANSDNDDSDPTIIAGPTPTAVSDSTPVTGGGPAFAAAIEASGVLNGPSADEVAQATDRDLYYRAKGIQVSAAGNYVSLRRCRAVAASTCGTGWAYVTGVAGGGEVHPGLLGGASRLDLHLLDDRYFVASESSPDAQAPSTAWLIDTVTGTAGVLSRRDEPTTLNAPEQALLLCQESYDTRCAVTQSPGTGLAKVVDARDGTIRPLAMPDDVVAGLTVAQPGTGRIWVGTDPDGDGPGLAYSDDGGAAWTEVALPEQVRATDEEDLEIAADGDRVAAATGWGGGGDPHTVYVSDDAGRSWTTTTPSEPDGNIGRLYVLADGRLVLFWSADAHPVQVLVSTGSEWAELEKVDLVLGPATPLFSKRFSVNRAGIALIPSFVSPCATSCTGPESDEGLLLDTIDFSTDLTNWSTIEVLDD